MKPEYSFVTVRDNAGNVIELWDVVVQGSNVWIVPGTYEEYFS